MPRVIFLLLAFLFANTPTIWGNHFLKGQQEYDNLNLTSALSHFENAWVELETKTPSSSRDIEIAEVLFYQSATYFFLRNIKSAQQKLAEALKYQKDCKPKNLILPDTLFKECEQILVENNKKLESEEISRLINVPKAIVQANLQFDLFQQKSVEHKKVAYWLFGASALPFGASIGFGFMALNAKSNFLQDGLESSKLEWRNHAIVTDVALSVGVALAVTGLVYYLFSLDIS
ncbi:MAG: hypothetical protein O2897_00455 [bacterium]|nr:hypothetical protein [bacterium]